jgi:hypothetical protein
MALSKEYLDILKAMALMVPAPDKEHTYAELLNIAKGETPLSEKVLAIAAGMGKELSPEQIAAVEAADLLTKEEREEVVAKAIGEILAEKASEPIGNVISTIFGWLTFWTKWL